MSSEESAGAGAAGPSCVLSRLLVFALFVIPVLSACGSMPPSAPLCPDEILRRAEALRRPREATGDLTLAQATRHMRSNNPEVRRARAAYRTALAVASTPTPRPNPTFEISPLALWGGEILGSVAGGVDAALGWTILPTNTPRLQDSVNAVTARAALTEAAGVERLQYLALRREYAGTILEDLRFRSWTALAETARASVSTARRLAEAGAATGLDVRLVELEADRSDVDVVAAREQRVAAVSRLAARMGRTREDLEPPPESFLPPLPSTLPTPETLRSLAMLHHPDLAVLRAQYTVAEKQLRLEYARRVPPFGIGASYEREGDLNILGLPISIEIPLSDRNQPGIAEAYARRCELQARYLALLEDVLAAVEASRALVAVRVERHRMIVERLEPSSTQAMTAARTALAAGGADALRLLEVLRSTRAIALDGVAARIDVYDAWIELEEACGAPLLRFTDEPGQPDSSAPPEHEEKQS